MMTTHSQSHHAAARIAEVDQVVVATRLSYRKRD